MPHGFIILRPTRECLRSYLEYETVVDYSKWAGFIIHHSGDEHDMPASRINDIHINERGWQMIGYHFVVRQDGSIETGRPLNRDGAHALGFNATRIGICLTGMDEFTEAQYYSLAALITEIGYVIPRIRNNIMSSRITEAASRSYFEYLYRPHHEKCPGPGFSFKRLRNAINTYITLTQLHLSMQKDLNAG